MINEIVCGDCFEIMEQIPTQSIDMILCDLPYEGTRNQWDKMLPCDKLWESYKRIIKPNGVIALTATQPFASYLISSNLDMFRYDLIWQKNKVTGFLNANKMPLRQHESILIFYQKLPTYNPQKSQGHKPVNSFTKMSDGSNYGKTSKGFKGGGQTDRHPTSILKFPVVNNDSQDKCHPTQKPIALFEYLIKTFTNENEIVLDNCIGSGTTAIAAIKSSRRFIGIDNNEDYCQIAKERIQSLI